jgi:hypothetical protein
MVDLNGHEAGNGGHSQGKPTAYRDSSTRRDRDVSTVIRHAAKPDTVRERLPVIVRPTEANIGGPHAKPKQSKVEPRTERPQIPGYGISKSKTGMLPWEWAVKTLTDSREYWVATVRSDGRPHAMIIWGLWFDGAFWFGTGNKTQKGTQLGKESTLYCGHSECCGSGDSGRYRRTDHRPSYWEEVRTSVGQQIWDERRWRL